MKIRIKIPVDRNWHSGYLESAQYHRIDSLKLYGFLNASNSCGTYCTWIYQNVYRNSLSILQALYQHDRETPLLESLLKYIVLVIVQEQTRIVGYDMICVTSIKGGALFSMDSFIRISHYHNYYDLGARVIM